jgi:hypothetical protein
MGNATSVLFKAGLIDSRTARADQITVSLVSPPTAADVAAPPTVEHLYRRDAFDMPAFMDELIAARVRFRSSGSTSPRPEFRPPQDHHGCLLSRHSLYCNIYNTKLARTRTTDNRFRRADVQKSVSR